MSFSNPTDNSENIFDKQTAYGLAGVFNAALEELSNKYVPLEPKLAAIFQNNLKPTLQIETLSEASKVVNDVSKILPSSVQQQSMDQQSMDMDDEKDIGSIDNEKDIGKYEARLAREAKNSGFSKE